MENDLDQAAHILMHAEHIVAFTGAGVSAESGLRTFRDANGLWEGHRPEDVATPEAFDADPAMVWRFYNARRAALWQVKPNPGHHALVELERTAACFDLVTQNVDRLHQRAGSKYVTELHGNLEEVRCTVCGDVTIRANENLAELPKCPHCTGLLRPAVVWFGEQLPVPALSAAQRAASVCDVMLIVGTSAVVYPAAGLAHLAHAKKSTIIEINPTQTDASHLATINLFGKSGEVLPAILARMQRRA